MSEVQSPWPYRDSSGEGPVWDPVDAALVRVDNDRGLVHWLDVQTGDQTSLHVGGKLGFVVPATTGECVASVGSSLVAIRRSGERRPFAIGLQEAHGDTFSLNDGKVDSRGRLFAGTINPQLKGGGGGLYRFDADGTSTRVLSDVSISNGLDWDDARGVMYWIDSQAQRIDQFDYDLDTGELSGRRVFADIDVEDGLPDGMTVDAEGGVWVVLFGTGTVRRYDPDGTVSTDVRMPSSCVTSIAFGGPDLSTAYVTSSSAWLPEEEKRTTTVGGSVFTFSPGVRGRAITPYRI